MEQIHGKIVAVLDPTSVVINRGSLDGVTKGLAFYVYTELGPFTDPDTGEDLGIIPQVWGVVTASNVAERLCIARTGYEYRGAWHEVDLLRGMLGGKVRVKLPVDEDEIAHWATKVHVGTKVVSKQPVQETITAGEKAETLPASPEALPVSSTIASGDSEEANSPEGEDDSDSHSE